MREFAEASYTTDSACFVKNSIEKRRGICWIFFWFYALGGLFGMYSSLLAAAPCDYMGFASFFLGRCCSGGSSGFPNGAFVKEL